MKNKIVIITVCIVLCLALLPLSSFTVSATGTRIEYFVPDEYGWADGSTAYSYLRYSPDSGAFNYEFVYNFTPDFYIGYRFLPGLDTSTVRDAYQLKFNNILSDVSSDILLQFDIQFATFIPPLDTYMQVIDSVGNTKTASFDMVTTENDYIYSSSTNYKINTYNFTALVSDFSGLVPPYSVSLIVDVPRNLEIAEGVEPHENFCEIPFTKLSALYIYNSSGGDTSDDTSGGDTSDDTSGDDTSGGDTSGGDTSGGDTSDDTSGGDTPGGDTPGGDTPGGSGGGYDDTELINRVDELLSSVESTNQTLVSINSNLTDAPLYLVNKIENAKLQIQTEKLNQDKIEDGLNDLEFPDQNEQNELLNNFANAFSGFEGFVDIGGSDGATLREVWAAIWGWEFCVAAVGLVASMIVIHKIMFG